MRNVSLGGMFIQCRPTSDPGGRVGLILLLPSGEAYNVDCVIRFTISSGAGVEFINPTNEMQQAIRVLFSQREFVP